MPKTIAQYLQDPHDYFDTSMRFFGSWIAIYTLAKSGFFELIDEEGEYIDELASQIGIRSDKLKRLVSLLAAEELIDLSAEGIVKTNSCMQKLLEILVPESVIFVTAMSAVFSMYEALKTDQVPFDVHYGKPAFEYIGETPDLMVPFAGYMKNVTSLVLDFLASSHTFKPFKAVVDVGGSHGDLLKYVLQTNPESRGVLFDLPEVANMVRDNIAESEVGDRIETVGGSFFESVPGADLYLLKMILHDWSDEESIAILKTIRQAILPNGRVAVLDLLIPETPSPHPCYSMDMAMMVWVSGRERKLSEFEQLFSAAGFKLDRVSENPLGHSVIEAVVV